MKQDSVSAPATGTGRVTVRAIAAEMGLSIATISRVLNGGGNVASDTPHWATAPRLTTVRQPLQEMGRTAVTLLMRQLDGHAHEALSMELETRLVVRESTGPVRRRDG